MKEKGASTKDVAKMLLDAGLHAPTVYFPLLVDEALMIEPCENETKEELDAYIARMIEITKASEEELHAAPVNSKVGRVDEVKAARDMVLCWRASGHCEGK